MAVISGSVFCDRTFVDFTKDSEIIAEIHEGDKLGWLDNKPVISEKGCFQGIRRTFDKCLSGHIADGEIASRMARDWVEEFKKRQIKLSSKGIDLFNKVKSAFEALARTYEQLNKKDVSQNYQTVASEIQILINTNNLEISQAKTFQSSGAIPVVFPSEEARSHFDGASQKLEEIDEPDESEEMLFGMTLDDRTRILPGGREEERLIPARIPVASSPETAVSLVPTSSSPLPTALTSVFFTSSVLPKTDGSYRDERKTPGEDELSLPREVADQIALLNKANREEKTFDKENRPDDQEIEPFDLVKGISEIPPYACFELDL